MTAPYTVQAIGESESITHVELTKAEVVGVKKVFDAVNAAEHKSRTYEPLLWLWKGHLTHEQIPANDFPHFDRGFIWPVNYPWYFYYRTRTKAT